MTKQPTSQSFSPFHRVASPSFNEGGSDASDVSTVLVGMSLEQPGAVRFEAQNHADADADDVGDQSSVNAVDSGIAVDVDNNSSNPVLFEPDLDVDDRLVDSGQLSQFFSHSSSFSIRTARNMSARTHSYPYPQAHHAPVASSSSATTLGSVISGPDAPSSPGGVDLAAQLAADEKARKKADFTHKYRNRRRWIVKDDPDKPSTKQPTIMFSSRRRGRDAPIPEATQTQPQASGTVDAAILEGPANDDVDNIALMDVDDMSHPTPSQTTGLEEAIFDFDYHPTTFPSNSSQTWDLAASQENDADDAEVGDVQAPSMAPPPGQTQPPPSQAMTTNPWNQITHRFTFTQPRGSPATLNAVAQHFANPSLASSSQADQSQAKPPTSTFRSAPTQSQIVQHFSSTQQRNYVPSPTLNALAGPSRIANSSASQPSGSQKSTKKKQRKSRAKAPIPVVPDAQLLRDPFLAPSTSTLSQSAIIREYRLSRAQAESIPNQGMHPYKITIDGRRVIKEHLCYFENAAELIAWRNHGGYAGFLEYLYRLQCRWDEKHPDAEANRRDRIRFDVSVPLSYRQPLKALMAAKRDEAREMEKGKGKAREEPCRDDGHA